MNELAKAAEVPLAISLLKDDCIPPIHEKFRCLLHDRLYSIFNNMKALTDYTKATVTEEAKKEEKDPMTVEIRLDDFLQVAPQIINSNVSLITSEMRCLATCVFGYDSFIDASLNAKIGTSDESIRYLSLIVAYNVLDDLEVGLKQLRQKFHDDNPSIHNEERPIDSARNLRFPHQMSFVTLFSQEVYNELLSIFNNCDETLYEISAMLTDTNNRKG